MKNIAWSMSFVALLLQLTARLSARLHSFGFIEDPLLSSGLHLGFELGGSILLITALIVLARAKNRCWAWGLLGIFSFVGMIVIARLREQKREGKSPDDAMPPAS